MKYLDLILSLLHLWFSRRPEYFDETGVLVVLLLERGPHLYYAMDPILKIFLLKQVNQVEDEEF